MEPDVLAVLPVLAAAAAGAVLVGFLVFRGVFRVWRTTFAVEAYRRGRWAWRTAIASLGALVALPTQRLPSDLDSVVQHVLVVVLIVALTWLATALLRAAELNAFDRHDISTPDNLFARRQHTRYVVMRRVGTVLTVLLGLAAVLLTFDEARAFGTSVLASAGVLGIIIGVAAQGVLKNLVAGVQIAFAEPIRLDDVVVVDGEWGWIEDITLTTVIVRVWDKRRLVYPTAWFTENAFQNWTRRDAALLAHVVLRLDFRADVSALRTAAGQIVEGSPHWDGDFHNVQVIDADESGLTVRVLATAVDGPTAWELRCGVREELVRWLVRHDPDALPVTRLRASDDHPA